MKKLTGSSMSLTTTKFINKYLLLVVFLFLYLWRPFSLGFYSDDWATLVGVNHISGARPFSSIRFNYYQNNFLNRPGQIIFFFIVSSLFQSSAFLWQTLNAILMLLSGYILQKLINLFLDLIRLPNPTLATIASTIWLALPWTLGISAWSVCAPATSSLIFFLLSFYFFLKAIASNSPRLHIISALFLLLSYSLYEAFFLQYLIFYLTIPLLLKPPAKKLKPILVSFFLLNFVQGATLIWNRIAVTPSTPVKTFYPQWAVMFRHYLTSLPTLLLQSLPEMSSLLSILTIITIVIFIFSLFISLCRRTSILPYLTIFPLILAYSVSIFVYSISGYGFFSLGPLSRTTFSASLWLLVTFTLVMAIISHQLLPKLQKMFYVLPLSFLLVLAAAAFLRTSDWAKAWELQQTILSQAPIDKINSMEPGATLIYITPNTVNEAFIFLAGYDLNNALIDTYPQIKSDITFCPHIPQQNGYSSSKVYSSTISWDGNTVFYNNSPYSDSQNVYVWDYYDQSFNKKETPFIIKNRQQSPFQKP